MKYKDKFWHFAISASFSVVFYFFIKNWLYVFLIIAALGLLKEFYDHFKKNKNTWQESALDFLADCAGFLTGFIILNYLFIIKL